MPSDDLQKQIAVTVAAFLDNVEQMLPQWNEQRSPQGFCDTELAIAKQCRNLQDAITELLLRSIVSDPVFQVQCSQAARSGAGGLRCGDRQGRNIELLGGSTIRLNDLEYLKPNRRGKKPGRKRGTGRRGKGGSGVIPVLAALGIWFGATPALAQEVCHQVADSDSLRCARSALERRGIKLGHNRIRNIFNKVSCRAVDQRNRWLEQQMSQTAGADVFLKGKRVMVSTDGGRIRTRISARSGRRRKNGHRGYKTAWREPKLLVIYVINNQGKIDQEFRPIYDGTLEDADAIFEMLAGYLKALGVDQARQLIFVADGAKWIWNRTGKLAERLGVPANRVVEEVDWYHAVETLWTIAKLPNGWSNAQRTKWVKKAKNLLFSGNISALVDQIAPLTKNRTIKAEDGRIKKANDHLDYFARNAARMQYETFKSDNIPLGSGCVESAVRRVVNMRMKSNGTFWGEVNAEGMLLMRSYLKAGRLNDLLLWSMRTAAPWWPPSRPDSQNLAPVVNVG